jgi:uncharacterized membrane protein
VVSGVVMGLSGLCVHLGMKGVRTAPDFALLFVANPWSWFALAFGVTAFVYMQKALYAEKVAYVVPTVSALSIVTPVVISAVVLDEYVSLLRWIGLWLIMVGVIGLGRSGSDDGFLTSMLKRPRKES